MWGVNSLKLALKLELLQHSGSFKARGAFANLLLRKVPKAGVVAASGGNHGAAVAYAAMTLKVPAKIFVPSVSSPAKIGRIREYGADLLSSKEIGTRMRKPRIPIRSSCPSAAVVLSLELLPGIAALSRSSASSHSRRRRLRRRWRLDDRWTQKQVVWRRTHSRRNAWARRCFRSPNPMYTVRRL